MKLSKVAKAVNGTFTGDGEAEIHAMASLLEAREGDISFLANPKYAALPRHAHPRGRAEQGLRLACAHLWPEARRP